MALTTAQRAEIGMRGRSAGLTKPLDTTQLQDVAKRRTEKRDKTIDAFRTATEHNLVPKYGNFVNKEADDLLEKFQNGEIDETELYQGIRTVKEHISQAQALSEAAKEAIYNAPAYTISDENGNMYSGDSVAQAGLALANGEIDGDWETAIADDSMNFYNRIGDYQTTNPRQVVVDKMGDFFETYANPDEFSSAAVALMRKGDYQALFQNIDKYLSPEQQQAFKQYIKGDQSFMKAVDQQYRMVGPDGQSAMSSGQDADAYIDSFINPLMKTEERKTEKIAAGFTPERSAGGGGKGKTDEYGVVADVYMPQGGGESSEIDTDDILLKALGGLSNAVSLPISKMLTPEIANQVSELDKWASGTTVMENRITHPTGKTVQPTTIGNEIGVPTKIWVGEDGQYYMAMVQEADRKVKQGDASQSWADYTKPKIIKIEALDAEQVAATYGVTLQSPSTDWSQFEEE